MIETFKGAMTAVALSGVLAASSLLVVEYVGRYAIFIVRKLVWLATQPMEGEPYRSLPR